MLSRSFISRSNNLLIHTRKRLVSIRSQSITLKLIKLDRPLLPIAATNTTLRLFTSSSILYKKSKKDQNAEQYAQKNRPNSAMAPELEEDLFHLAKFETEANKAIEWLKNELSKLRASGATMTPDVVEKVLVVVDKETRKPTPLSDLAHVAPRGGREFIVTVNEVEHVKKIVTACLATLSLNPQVADPNTPNVLRVPIPPPTQESRNDAAAKTKTAGNKAYDAISSARNAVHKYMPTLVSKRKATPDGVRKAEKELQKLLDNANKTAKDLVKAAEQAIMKN